VHCNVCGTWIVEVDGRGEVLRTNRKVAKREHRETPATITTDGITLGPDLFMFPGTAHRLVTVYVCACRSGAHRVVSDIPAQPTDTL
jgi:hypothetical protein